MSDLAEVNGGRDQDQGGAARRSAGTTWLGLSLRLAARASVRPRLAMDLLRVAWRFRRRNWYRQLPFLPVPDRTYIRWRMYTAYGDSDIVPPVEDVIRYARWAARD